MPKISSTLRYTLPFLATVTILVVFSLLKGWSFPLSWLIFYFLIVPFTINMTARKFIPARNKIAPILINLSLFHSLVWFMNYETDMGTAALLSLPINLIVLAIYDWVVKGGPVKIRST